MNIWIISPEYAPYVSLGGISTGIRSLAEVLRRWGHTITIVVPTMGEVPQGARRIAEIDIEGPDPAKVTIFEIEQPDGIRIFVFDVPGFDPRFGGYGLDVSDDPNVVRRPGMFARAAVEFIAQRSSSEHIDLVHAHEWPTAMVLYLLRERGIVVAKIFTIHNLVHQGFFPVDALRHFGLGFEHAVMDRLELYGRISLLKGALVAADQITTVSPTYAREIQLPEHGELLDGVLRARRSVLSGIVNGIDTQAWNPATDESLPARFHADDISGKRLCKQKLCIDRSLRDPDKPLVAFLGRLVEQKGIDWVLDALPSLIEAGVNVVIAGSGSGEYVEQLRRAESTFSGRMAFCGHVSDLHARLLLAAADLLLMPSRWEPCGLVQLEAMRYGVLPIVRRTGGLSDTVIDELERPDAANGFVFDAASSSELTKTTVRAIHCLGTSKAAAMQRRGMTAALGWEGPARSYLAVYRAAMRK